MQQGLLLAVPGHGAGTLHGSVQGGVEPLPQQDIHDLLRRLECQDLGLHLPQKVTTLYLAYPISSNSRPPLNIDRPRLEAAALSLKNSYQLTVFLQM